MENPGLLIQNTPLGRSSGGTYIAPKIGDPCQNCGKRPSTKQWIGDGGALAMTHGFYKLWCDVCVLTAQLKHARAQAKKIPDLERLLRNAKRRKT